MADLNKQALEMWNSMKPMIDREIEQQTKGTVQRRKAKVTTAPSLVTQKIGVTEPFGDQYFIPFNTNLSTAKVGDVVWVEFMYGATNAFASMYATADTKDVTVGGVLDVVQRRCYATLSSAGWYRVMEFVPTSIYKGNDIVGSVGSIIRFYITRRYYWTGNETHEVSLSLVNTSIKWMGEESNAVMLGIDKIRYTTNSTTNKAYVDVHYILSQENQVGVNFNVYCPLDSDGINYQTQFTSKDFVAVADAPAGETVLTTHSFSAKTVTDISSEFVLNTSISGITGGASAIFDASTQTVDVGFYVYASASFSSTPVFTCNNAAHRPKTASDGTAMIHSKTSGEWFPYKVGINTSGQIAQGFTSAADRIYGHIKYEV